MLRVYNTLSREKESFQPLNNGHVRMYVCGMTVYGDAHIGHARTYLAFDIIKRYLEYKGYDVTYVQNVTDVDDKIINAARERGIPPLEHSAEYTERCLSDLEALGIQPADEYPRASEHIEDMIALIEDIIDNGYGYAADGDVYFSVESFDGYGKLSGQRVKEMKAGARIEPGDKKHSPLDFTLWKAAKPGEPAWPSPWGEGRPGWHIECSTMSTSYLGAPFDIHGGGHDLVFPHHENEIAQAEAGLQEQFARYWLHSGMLNVDGEKMSKSLGNFVTIRDALQRWDAETLRFFFASYHYRSPADFSQENMEMAQRRLERIHRLRDDLQAAGDAEADIDEAALGERDEAYLGEVRRYRERFEAAMDDDFNTPEAIAVLFDFMRESNRYLTERQPDGALCHHALETLLETGRVLTLFQEEHRDVDREAVVSLARKYGGTGEGSLDEVMAELLGIRKQARRDRDYETADAIRDDLEQLGFEVQDTDDGVKWRIA